MFEGLLGKVASDLVSPRSDTLMGCVIVSDTRRMESTDQASVPRLSQIRVNTTFQNANRLGSLVTCCRFGSHILYRFKHIICFRVSGGETSATTLLWWLLAMIAYPEVQIQAHAELDEVVGNARPPTFADIPSLPYIRAMVKETLRWSLTVPFGVPHATTEDDWYDGMFIPKGTVCLQNMRVINSEPDVFGSDAVRFDPTRYMDESRQVKVLDGREEGHMAFGFGRRICPGRYVAEGTLVIDIATLLWAMRFERPEGVKANLDVRTIVNGSVTAYVVFRLVSLWIILTRYTVALYLSSTKRSLGSQRLKVC